MRDDPKMAANGYGQCPHEKLIGTYHHGMREHNCTKFIAAKPDDVEKRIKFILKLNFKQPEKENALLRNELGYLL
jgi:hypothetical protein